jgi:hypothetical protein
MGSFYVKKRTLSTDIYSTDRFVRPFSQRPVMEKETIVLFRDL